jgi:hypothetical protein
MTPRSISLALAIVGGIAATEAASAQTSLNSAENGGSIVTPRPLSRSAGTDAAPRAYLESARQAVERGHPGEAREALERAETRLLDSAVVLAGAGEPDTQRAVLDVGIARHDLTVRDHQGAIRAIDDALLVLELVPRSPPAPTPTDLIQPAPLQGAPISLAPADMSNAPSTPPPIAAVTPAPSVTYALLPGHWQLKGARYVWIRPETAPRLVVARRLVPHQNVWEDGHWVYVPSHYAMERGN